MTQWFIENPDSPSKPIHQIISGLARGGFYTTNDNDQETSRATLLDMLDAAGYPSPSPENPVYVHRADTGNLERNTGNGWEIYPKSSDDTGWVNGGLSGGYTATAPVRARRIGDVIYWEGRVSRDAGNFTAGTQSTVSIGGVPPPFRPRGSGPGARTVNNGANSTAYCTVDGAGNMYLVPIGTGNNNYHLGGLSGYLAN